MDYPVIMPDMGENIDQGLITRIEVAVGDEIAAGQTLIEVESDKVVLEVPAEISGTLQGLTVKEGDEIKPGQQFGIISSQTADRTITPVSQQDTVAGSVPVAEVTAEVASGQQRRNLADQSRQQSSSNTYAGPSAQRLARELGIAIDRIAGSATNGRISCADIKAFVRHNQTGQRFDNRPALPDFSEQSSICREGLNGIAKTTARRMAATWERVPHAWLQVKVDITKLELFREKQKTATNNKLSLTVYLLKMLAQTLKQFPRFNACFDEATEELILKQDIPLGLAVDTPRGLLVPVIRNVNNLTLLQLADQLEQITASGRQNSLTSEQLRGGSMTLSNLGGMGVDSLFPIINWPEVAILGVGRTVIEPLWINTQFSPRTMLTLVLGFDHRVINGADGARFLNQLKKLLEHPFLSAMQ